MSEEPRSEQVEKFLSVQRAARAVADSAADWWQRLNAASSSALTDETLDLLYRDSLAAMQTVLGADEVSILLANEEQDALVARASIGLGEEATVELLIPTGEGMAGQVLATRRPLVIDDLTQIRLVSPVLREQGQRSVVAVPIVCGNRILGVLHAGSRQLGHFTDSDAELLGILAERLADALDRVRLFEQQRRLAELASFLATTARIMSGASSFTETLDALARSALPALGDICLIDVVDDGTLRRIVARHVDPAQQHLVDRLRDEFAPTTSSDHPAAEVIRMGGSRWSPSMSDDFLRSTTHSNPHYELTKALRFRSYMVVPISASKQTIGALTMVSCSRALTEADVEFAETLSQQVGSVVSKAQQLDIAVRTSHALQAALLPEELPRIPRLTIHASYVAAAASLEVGGDFFDVMALPEGRAWLMIGDVEGHDQRAAAVMGQLRSAARVLVSEGNDPVGVIRGLRACWDSFGFRRLATALVGEIDPATGLLTLASAGHPPPIVVGEHAELVPVASSPLLGVDAAEARRFTMTLQLGQVLLLYTDGALSERALGLSEGLERLCKVALSGEREPQAICERIVEMYQDRDDDLALLAVRRIAVESDL